MSSNVHALPLRALPASPLPALARRDAPSVSSGIILAFIVLALLLQASFFAGLASGQLSGAQPVRAPHAVAR